ncbi:MAG: hypothetical protein JWP75_1102 [Frondihabitans sp.]|nr:hypothetical protein [Frondihabitans sp.]
MPELQLRGVGRLYRGAAPVEALRGIDLTIEQGDFVAIEGPSGGGKSTLLNIIGLLDVPTVGNYRVGATNVGAASQRSIAELRSDQFAFIFQSFHLLSRRPVIDSVEMGLLYRGVPQRERRLRAARALADVGLAQFAWQRASKLSGGQQQRVAIARALAAGAPVIVADEPTGNLDSHTSDAIVESLQHLNRAGSTIVLVTHSPSVADSARRRLKIQDGQLHEDSTPRDFQPLSVPSDPIPKAPGSPSRVRPIDILRDAASSISSRLGRTTGLIAAVGVGVALAVATLGISESASAQVSSTFNAHTNRDVTLSWNPDGLAGVPKSEQATMLSRLDKLNGVTASAQVSNFGDHGVQGDPARPTFQVTTYGVTPDIAYASRSSVHWSAGHSHHLGQDEVLLGSSLAKQMALGPLDAEPVVSLDGRDVTVVGLIASSPRIPDFTGSVLAPMTDKALLGSGDQQQILLLTTPGAAQEVAKESPLVVDAYQPRNVSVDRPVDPTSVRAQVEADVQSTLLALTGVALLASIAGLANAMILSVLERKQEFGLRRAVGARPVHLVSLVLTESTIVGAIGGVVGLAFGLAGILAITVLRHWSPVFDLRLAPTAILGGILVGALGGAVASARASRIQPNEALRQ